MNWKKIDNNNVILVVSDDLYISYNPSPFNDFASLSGDKKSEETALVLNKGETFLILNGDFREEYEYILKAGKGKKELIEKYNELKSEYQSSWSSDYTLSEAEAITQLTNFLNDLKEKGYGKKKNIL